MTDYVEVNRALWDERAAPHASSPDYEVERFVSEPEHLSRVVASTCPDSATSPVCGAYTCNAISAPTPCPCTGSVPA